MHYQAKGLCCPMACLGASTAGWLGSSTRPVIKFVAVKIRAREARGLDHI